MCTVLLPPRDNPIAVNKYIESLVFYRILYKNQSKFNRNSALAVVEPHGNITNILALKQNFRDHIKDYIHKKITSCDKHR